MKKLLTVIITLAMALTMFVSGCSNSTSEQLDLPNQEAENKDGDGNDKSTDPEIVTPAGEYPIVKEKATLNVLISGSPTVKDFATNEFTKWYEEKTNIHINFEVVDPKEAEQKLNLVLTSGDYPDVIVGFGISPTKQIVYGKQGVFRPLNDLIEKYGYGTKEMFEAVPGEKEVLTSPDGNIYGLPQISENPHTFYPQKMWIYEPWLKKLNLKMPTTTEEFYSVLKAFKTEDPNENGKADEIPLAAATKGFHMQIENFLMNAFVYTNKSINHYLILNNGKISTAYDKPGWKQGLQYLNKLYTEGLLSAQSFTQDQKQYTSMGENPIPILGAGAGGAPAFTQLNGSSGRWNEYVAVPPLIGPDGVQFSPRSPSVNANAQFVITSACEIPEVAFRWGDMMYTEEVTLRNDNGVLNQDWRWAEQGEKGLDGKPGIWAKIVDSGNSLQNNEWQHIGPILQSERLRTGIVSKEGELPKKLYDETMAKYAPVGKDDHLYVPPLYFNEKQASELVTLEKTIIDYVSESQARFITGDLDIDSGWQSYLDTLHKMNLDRLVQIYQEAYDSSYK